MASFQPKPYRLANTVQHYEWGTRNQNAFIPHFLGRKPEPDTPYAELWIGAHPKCPSEIWVDGKSTPLNQVISTFPEDILGKQVSLKSGNQLPFLLKVLSAGQALSIQLHPNKSQAEVLHRKDPKNYPDDNHKPEIAIALDHLTALAGFQPVASIQRNLIANPEIGEFAGTPFTDAVISAKNEDAAEKAIKKLYAAIMKKAEAKPELDRVIPKLVVRLSSSNKKSPAESQFLTQHLRYGNDVGLFSFFFFNLIELKAGQAIFTGAGIPHAYLDGNIVECMANSDNVVRAGLTPKFKDVDTLLDIIVYQFGDFNLINSEQKTDQVIFKTEAAEFEITGFTKPAGFTTTFSSHEKPSVFLVTEGKLSVSWPGGVEVFNKGDFFLIPACLGTATLKAESQTAWYVVQIP